MRVGVPDSTLRFQLARLDGLLHDPELSPTVVRFLESPYGIQFLHRILVSEHLAFGLANDAGIRNICWFLRLAGLAKFVPASYGAQQALASQLEERITEYGQQEEQRLATGQPQREISLVLDETFHPQICLVAIEPVATYLVLEQYAPQRDADTWKQCLDERLTSWSVHVCQVTSDEAKALITLAEERLGAHHSPDLFHVQHD